MGPVNWKIITKIIHTPIYVYKLSAKVVLFISSILTKKKSLKIHKFLQIHKRVNPKRKFAFNCPTQNHQQLRFENAFPIKRMIIIIISSPHTSGTSTGTDWAHAHRSAPGTVGND